MEQVWQSTLSHVFRSEPMCIADVPTIPLLAEFFRISLFFPPFQAELWKFRFFHEFL